MTDANTDPAVVRDEAGWSLGDLEPAASRHNWTRSGVTVHDGSIVVGTADGRVRSYDPDGECRWEAGGEEYAVSLAADDELVVVGGRGPTGRLRVLSRETGEQQWTYLTAEDVGSPARETFFAQPYVVDVAIAGDRIVVVARRYERDGDVQHWSSVVYGFDRAGELQWSYDARASPIAADVADGRVAVAYNRCPANHDHDHGLVVLETETGTELTTWDPGTPGERRVGDVAITDERIAVASHGDKHGYLLEDDGAEAWCVDLASECETDDETLYAYPNHVAVVDGTAIFVTGNTYAAETRDPDGRHPNEHTAVAVDLESGETIWSHDVRGFARCLSADDGLVAVPSAQNFRERDADTHAVHLLEAGTGPLETRSIEGISTAVSLSGDRLAVIEEPVEYHDEGVTRGAYRLHTWRLEG
ncbi:PQQ-binding-like beta-propeller repeat protein [Natrialbaceae archaeon AArc-T1-2]|uniref:outer membrane protein assembly factor BamB family protein n=1 Tax=Natrialbaceae archaeon AArc-T1-2 TaxID=3053904 RepID=UPI00255B3D00|nr:PQQ-binding-like beta-propeller repeat protein [Natrialbaceae archaeon AArc-T1-2]WIV66468.1 PQQ-binding-like beta-propeller repeat protein [Natrialbaceae archaeon AArc-T1-2]